MDTCFILFQSGLGPSHKVFYYLVLDLPIMFKHGFCYGLLGQETQPQNPVWESYWYTAVLVRFWFFSSLSVLKPRFLRFHGTGSGTSARVPTSRYQGFGTRISGGYLHSSNFGNSSVPFRFLFGSILAPKQVEPKALVLEPELSGTLTVQNSWYQKTEVAVLSVFSVLDQH